MKAVALVKGSGSLQLVDVPEPVLEQPDQVLVRVLQIGVCGTDRAMARGEEEAEPPPGASYLVLGHEMAGRVEQVGPGVRGLRPGDLAIASVRRGCGECESCSHGESDRCYTGRFRERGILGVHGFMTSLIVEQEANLVPLPDTLERIGFLAEPLSTCEKALETVRRLQARLSPRCGHHEHAWDGDSWGLCKRALVVGAGPVGMLTAFLLRLHHVSTVVVARHPGSGPPGRLAQSIGAAYLNIAEAGYAGLGPLWEDLDLVVDATGAPTVAFEVASYLKSPNSVVLLLGVPGGRHALTVDTAALVRQMVLANQTMLGSVNANLRHLRMAVQHLAQFQERFGDAIQQVVSHTYPLEQFREAFFHPPAGAIKVSLTPSG